MNTEVILALLPEIVLIAAAVGIYFAGAFWEVQGRWSWAAVGAIVAAAVLLARQDAATIAGGTVAVDALTNYGRWFALAFGLLMALIGTRPIGEIGEPEYVGSLVLLIAGMMLVTAATDLVLLFVGLELISIPTYILLALGRRDLAAKEATAKYFFLSVLASAVLLYGFSFLYGVSGSTDLAHIGAKLTAAEGLAGGKLVRLALVFIIAGLGFRITVVPLQFYAPDVYQGTSHANAALLSVAPKAAGFFVLVRLLTGVMPTLAPLSWKIALALALLSMTLGNFMALWQDNIRRMMAYSSIAHTGYLLMGLAAALVTLDEPSACDGSTAVLFYLAVYAAATTGVFAALAFLDHDGRQIDGIGELAGLASMRPWTAAAAAVCLFSLAGLPPLAGFWGKFLLFTSVWNVDAAHEASIIRPWFIALAIIGVVNAAVAAGYYLRVIATMYFRTPLSTSRAHGSRGAWLAAMLSALIAVGLGVYAGPLIGQAAAAKPTLEKGE